MTKVDIRRAKPSDSEQIFEIYRPIIEDTVISFETSPPSVEQIARRIASTLNTHEWLVAQSGNEIVGYTYATQYRSRQAYRRSTETTVYVHRDHRAQGVGRSLYLALFESLRSLDFHQAYAGIALPNEGSIALHEALGFERIGIFKEAGFKFDSWHDVLWLQRHV